MTTTTFDNTDHPWPQITRSPRRRSWTWDELCRIEPALRTLEFDIRHGISMLPAPRLWRWHATRLRQLVGTYAAKRELAGGAAYDAAEAYLQKIFDGRS